METPEHRAAIRVREIRDLNALGSEVLIERAGDRLLVLDMIDDLHAHFAHSVASRVAANNAAGHPTRMILPYGPTGQYPILRDLLNRKRISLKTSMLFFMDEYADSSGRPLRRDHPLSFRQGIAWLWEALHPDLRPRADNVIFPGPDNALAIERRVADEGIEVCYGGIGIHGHIAFNEPTKNVAESGVRLVELNDFTVTMNAIRSQVGGDLENFPQKAWTLGLRQCFAAKRVELYCRNDVFGLDWANTVLRLAVLGEPGYDYPVTLMRTHANYQVITDRRTADKPRRQLG